jgi:hypothetical protein
MKRLAAIFIGAIFGVGLMGAAASAAEATAAPTFNHDVAPILFRHCAECHRPSQIAPMSLLSYSDARPWAKAIRSKVVAREMPPWFADPTVGRKLANDTSLTQAEIDTLAAWADAGAPQGEGEAPPLPHFSGAGWRHPSGRDPDLIVTLPVEWTVAAEGEMPNFNLYSPLPLKENKLFEAIQVLPGNVAATHHITLGVQNLPPGMTLGTGPAWPGGPITSNVLVAAKEGAPVSDVGDPVAERNAADDAAGGGLGAYIPGSGARVSRPGHARQIQGGRFGYVRWNLHYQATGRPETARPSFGLWWATGPVTGVEQTLGLREQTSDGKQLVAVTGAPRRPGLATNVNPLLAPIPPNAANWTVTGIGAFQDDATIWGINLHMHLRGKDVTYLLTYPDGREQVLLRVPKYDFNWQLPYEFAEPLKVPAGSTVKAIARYDNSGKNRMNPAPNKEVYWSEQSWDDMFLTSVRYTVDKLEKPAATTQGGAQH